MSSRDEYMRKMQAKLEEWNAEIDTLTAKADEVTADARNKYHEQIESLKATQAASRQKIEELQQAGERAWEDLTSGIELAWTAMGEAIESARSSFQVTRLIVKPGGLPYRYWTSPFVARRLPEIMLIFPS